MSWSKFNDSFNSLKGQLTTFVQDTLIPEDEDDEEGEKDSPEVRLEQMSSLCTAQENEVIIASFSLWPTIPNSHLLFQIQSLRRQVAELRQSVPPKQPVSFPPRK